MPVLLLILTLTITPSVPLPGGPVAVPMAAESLPAGPGSMAPTLFQATATGPIHMVWLEPSPPVTELADHWRVQYSRSSRNGWTDPVTIVERQDLFVNWADVPAVAVAGNGAVVVSWLQKSGPDTYAYDAMVARSTDSGKTWTVLGPLHDDGTKTEHGFVSLVPEGQSVRAFWLDGRAMTEDAHGHGSGDMMIRTAIVDQAILAGPPLDERVCECCNTAAVGTSKGPIVAYRDRSDEEVRDIAIVRIQEQQLKQPVVVHDDGWALAGCPVNGPAMDALGETIALAWFTGTGDESVQVVFASESGTFSGPVPVAGTAALGRVDVVLRNPNEAVVSWIESSSEQALLRARVVTREGKLGPPLTITTVPPGRRSGFPRLARRGDLLLVIWTSTDRDKGLQAMVIPPAALPAPLP